ncbi:hypothetical protein PVK06_024446 [Gossypium arboreum]|uniref:Uncharacterized protein n=1 Tax=Gossypium arboreum TaxID=29729 RepID=A0ABR0PE60_GOSAR|nr:hypothetical protein PVK06_024446 [Gossypium arboreum]
MDESEQDPRRLTSTSSSSSSTTSVHVTALDGLVNVNSLFTIAVFVGLSLTTPGQHSLENRAPCDAGIDVAKKLLVFEVVSFSFFLFSSLVAQGLKLAINLLNSKDVDEAIRAHINLKVLRLGMMGSAVGSVMGCLFLMLSMVNVIEIRLGMLSCGSKSAVHSVTALVLLVESWAELHGIGRRDFKLLLDQRSEAEFEWISYVNTNIISCTLLEKLANQEMWDAKTSLVVYVTIEMHETD